MIEKQRTISHKKSSYPWSVSEWMPEQVQSWAEEIFNERKNIDVMNTTRAVAKKKAWILLKRDWSVTSACDTGELVCKRGLGGEVLPIVSYTGRLHLEAQTLLYTILLPNWHPFIYIPRAKLHPFPYTSRISQAFMCFTLLFLPKLGTLSYP